MKHDRICLCQNFTERCGWTKSWILLFQIAMTHLTLQNKHNICTLSANINFICARFKTGEKSSHKAYISSCF
jgi:hypothetical protein